MTDDAQNDGSHLGPVEIIQAGTHRPMRRSVRVATSLTAASLVLTGLILQLVHQHGDESAPRPTPDVSISTLVPTGTPGVSLPPTLPNGTLGPALAIGDRYLRFDAARGIAIVTVVLVPASSGPIQLTGWRVADAPTDISLRFVTNQRAQYDLAAPFAAEVATWTPGSPTALTVESGGQGALEILIRPDCSKAPYLTYPFISLDFRTGPSNDLHTFGIPADMTIVRNWFDDAVAEACGNLPTSSLISTTSTLDNLRISTVGPAAPNAANPFVVTVTATNERTTTFRGAVGVMLFDRALATSSGNVFLVDVGLNVVQLGGDPGLQAWDTQDPVVNGVVAIGSGALRTLVAIKPHQSARFTFLFELGRPENVIGPATAWVPAVEPAGQHFPDHADPGAYPRLVRPIV